MPLHIVPQHVWPFLGTWGTKPRHADASEGWLGMERELGSCSDPPVKTPSSRWTCLVLKALVQIWEDGREDGKNLPNNTTLTRNSNS